MRDRLKCKILKLTTAPYKPQQRVWILQHLVNPSVLYQLTTGAPTIGLLRSMDRDIRAVIRKWLRLPNDTPNAYFHADIKEGGLGITSLRYLAPLIR